MRGPARWEIVMSIHAVPIRNCVPFCAGPVRACHTLLTFGFASGSANKVDRQPRPETALDVQEW